MSKLQIISFAQADDNYAWLIVDDSLKIAALVDAVCGDEIKSYLNKNDLKLTHILNTHHHWDHIGANKSLLHKDLIIVASKYDFERKRIPYQNKSVIKEDIITFGDSKIIVKELKGHTLGHIGYLVENHFFCGDTIFLGGCGRLFEGTYIQMHNTINSVLNILDDETLLYPAHEYSKNNLLFSKSLILDDICKEAIDIVDTRLENKACSLPTRVLDEKRWNPFYRINELKYLKSLNCLSNEAKTSPELAFKEIRILKDNF
ncbi:MAG: hydroxyacylglutathione hydrolase [Candidatus Cloacimonadota bacterium]|nr:MAG: hydroxyacylglutathione hydrolase [Candidatus Cloacimonadota bacterium]